METRIRDRFMTALALPPRHLWILVPVVMWAGVAHARSFSSPRGIAGLYIWSAQHVAATALPPADLSGFVPSELAFAYPPLGFYILAGPLVAGVDPLTLAAGLPWLWVLLAGVGAYGVGRELFDNPATAACGSALTVALLAVRPRYVYAQGTVETIAAALFLLSLYAGFRTFSVSDTPGRWPLAFGALTGATILTHPHWALMMTVAAPVPWLVRDRSWAGFRIGCRAAGVTLLFVAPWFIWLQITQPYGIGQLLVAETYLSPGLPTPANLTGPLLPLFKDPPLVWLPMLGVAASIYERNGLVPIIAATSPIWTGKHHLSLVLSGLLIAGGLAAATHWVINMGARYRLHTPSPVAVATVMLAIIVVVGAAVATPRTRPPTMTDDYRTAIEWADAHAAPDESIVVPGKGNEWVPVFVDRPMPRSRWGAEWSADTEGGSGSYERLATCYNTTCLRDAAGDLGATYIVTGESRLSSRTNVLHRVGRFVVIRA